MQVTRVDHSGLFPRRLLATARTDNRRCDVILGCGPGVRKRTVGAIELVLDIFARRTNPRFVEADNLQTSAIRENDGFGDVVDQQDHMFFSSDRVPVPGLIGNNDLGRRTIKLSARLLRLTHLHQRG
jgi:hypothetical protein